MSARRRARAALVASPGGVLDPAGRPPLPEHLARFDPAEWIDPARLPPGLSVADAVARLETIPREAWTDVEGRINFTRAMARLRWHRARRQWARDHGYTMRELAGPPAFPSPETGGPAHGRGDGPDVRGTTGVPPLLYRPSSLSASRAVGV